MAHNILEVIAHARCIRRVSPSESMIAEIRRYADAFDALADSDPTRSNNLFTFHVDVPSSHRVINYVDVKHDHGLFEYPKLVDHLSWACSKFNPGTKLYLVTHLSSGLSIERDSLTIVRAAADERAPMFERVKAMAGYVHSAAFNRDTAFLDTDAFPNRSFEPIFRRSFDVAVTFRTTPGYMPINEGVLFCHHQNKAAVQRFFDAYLATYEQLISDPLIIEYYGNIERWRGGQLSLNAIGWPDEAVVREVLHSVDGVDVRFLPCNEFNYWVQQHNLDKGLKSWDRKFVLHLKGDSKWLVDKFANYQKARRKDYVPPQRRNIASVGK